MNRKITLLLPLILLSSIFGAMAQCPPNIDFESGLGNWIYYRGRCFTGTPMTYTLASTAPILSLHTLTTSPGTDPYGGFNIVAPGGGVHSLRIGKDSNNYSTMRARYYVRVPSTPGVYSLIYKFAVVLQDPGHGQPAQPRFTVEARDSITGVLAPCDSFNYVASGSVPGFLPSSTTGVVYKTWTTGNLKFPGLGGRTMAVDFTAAGCGYSGHWGYGYADMSCGFFAAQVVTCASGSTVLAGPDGYSAYQWYDSATFSTSYGTSQIVTISAPTVATTYAVILTPFTGYGCVDTLYSLVIPSNLRLNPTPTHMTGSVYDTTICSGTPVTISAGGTSTDMPILYSWAPTTGLSCNSCMTTVASPTVTTTYTVTATDGAGCTDRKSIQINVFSTPGTIGGPTVVCPGATITKTNTVSGGVWSASPTTVGSIAPFSGILTGISSGTVTVVYTIGGSCTVSTIVSVHAAPPAISPSTARVCIGSCITLSNATTGGTWVSSVPGIATVGSSTGIVCGAATGVVTITYTVPGTGCQTTRLVTVDPSPTAILGVATVCVGGTTSLFSTGGGTWSPTSDPVATVGSTTGVVTGHTAGTTIITYTLPVSGCSTTRAVTVNPPPAPITGTAALCEGGFTALLSCATPGGSWSSSNPTIAFVDFTGTWTSGAAGTATITYTDPISGCWSTRIMTVYPNPATITGTTGVCLGDVSLLSCADPGTWSSSNPAVGSIDPTSGVVTGVGTGSCTITITSVNGCITTTPFSVFALPAPITGTATVCVGTCTTLSDATTPGSFSTSGIYATVNPGGLVCGTAVGTQDITYTEAIHGCKRTRQVTVNTNPGPITGSLSLCPGQSTTVSNSVSGGTWTIAPTTVATVSPTSGVITAITSGTFTVTYSIGAGCFNSAIGTVNPLPSAITGPGSVCINQSITLSSSPGGGMWSSSPTITATVNPVSGVVFGAGTGVATITYTLPTTCAITKPVTVNPIPLPIVGPGTVCVGQCITLTNATGGGTWASLSPGIVSIGSTSGVACGVTLGTATIRYQITATGCFRTTSIVVNPIPPAFTVTGGGTICAGDPGRVVGLSGSTSGVSYQLYVGGTPTGTPVNGTGFAITFGPQTTAGTYTVVGTNTTTTCPANMTGSVIITVNPLPLPIVGPTAVCVGATIILTDGMPGGTWSSGTPSSATIHPTSGVVTGITTGTFTVIRYTLPTTCYITHTVNVSPSPTAITGPSAVCVNDSILLTDTVTGGSWTSSSPTVATVNFLTGMVYGHMAGTTTITYSLGTGCTVTKLITVTSQPAPILGPGSVCAGQCITQTNATAGGVWSVHPGSMSLGSISSAGVFCAATTASGPATILYTASGGTGCAISRNLTINPIPSPIVGPSQLCQGACTTLTIASTGGSWSVTPTSAATISGTGLLCAVSTGSVTPVPVTVSYTALGCPAIAVITMQPLPSLITGVGRVCQGFTTALGSTPGGGTWSSSSTLASVDPSTGVVTGASTGTGIATITYSLPITGCYRTTPVTVNATPAPIIGPAGICVGQIAVFSSPTPLGTWSSSNPTIAPIGAGTGSLVGGAPGGLATISYTVGSCSAVKPLTILPLPAPIGGPLNVCMGQCVTLTDATPGGSWGSSLTGIATIDAAGQACGITSGTTIITYGTGGPGGCNATRPLVVNSVVPIQGNLSVCQGMTTALLDTAVGGTWTSLSPSVATVDPVTGVVTGVLSGATTFATATIQYTLPTGCIVTAVVTVNPLPGAITGTAIACAGDIAPMFTTSSGGTWSSSAPAVASVDAGTGVVTAISAGTTTITYSFTPGTGCFVTRIFSVNATPPPISGPGSVCVGSSMVLTGVGAGIWSSSDITVADVGSTTGIVTGYIAGMSATISFTLITGCNATKVVNVINPPGTLSGPSSVCQGSMITLTTSSTGGTWISSNPLIASVNSAGDVTGGTPGVVSITYSVGTGCVSPGYMVTVNPIPVGITPFTPNICVGGTVTLTSTPGGTWTSTAPTVATIDPTGLVTGVSAGSAVISYVLPTGCGLSTIVFVNPGPAAITGLTSVCIGTSSALSNATPGGVWTSTNPSVATIDPTFGVVTGVTLGTTVITYSVVGLVCPAVTTVTVNPFPMPITGSMNVCQGATTTLSNSVPGGVWSSSTPSIASIDPSTGVVTAAVTGSLVPDPVIITYTLGAGGCDVNTVIMVNPLPLPITGVNKVCEGQASTLASASPGGTWSSSAPAIGSIDALGMVTGVLAGVTTISYDNSYGCYVTHPMTVNVTPTPITGSANVCLGGTSALSNTVPGGNWYSVNPAIATVGSVSGVVTGVSLGSTTITYVMPLTGCAASRNITVVPLPVVYVVTGGGNHCAGDAGVAIGLSGSAVGVNYMLYNGSTAVGGFAGTGSAISFGMLTVAGTYTVIGTTTATGCSNNMAGSANVNILPSVVPAVTLNLSPNDTVCEGTSVTYTPVPVNGGTAPSYLWRVNGFPVATTGTYSYVPANGDVVSLVMTSNAICPVPSTADRLVNMTVQPFGTPDVSLSLSPNDTVCQGTVLTITAVSAFGGPAPIYTWRKNNTIVGGSGPTYTFAPVNNEVVYVIMNSSYPCRLAPLDSSTKVKIKIDTPVMPVVTITANPGFVVGPTQPTTLTAVAPNAVNPTYQWFINGFPVAGATNAAFTRSGFNAVKQDSVSCEVTSHDYCVSTGHEWIYIKVSTVGVSTLGTGSDITVVPNPNKGEFMIKGALASLVDEDVSLEITNMIGQVVYKDNVVAKSGKMNERVVLGGNIANGMYILSLRSGSDTKVFHLVIEQ